VGFLAPLNPNPEKERMAAMKALRAKKVAEASADAAVPRTLNLEPYAEP